MKNFILSFSLVFSVIIAVTAQDDATLETRIHDSYTAAWRGEANHLEKVINELTQQASTDRNTQYWEAYANYRLAIYYTAQKRKKDSKAKTNRALEILENIKKKNSEEYALLSLVTGFSIQFRPLSAASLGPKSGGYAAKSIKLDDNNPRGHFATANSDFYTPKMFGGGDLVEEHLKKALNLSYASTTGNPTWSKDEVYELLVRFYIREDQTDDAKFYCKMGLKHFPYDARLKQHASDLGMNQ